MPKRTLNDVRVEDADSHREPSILGRLRNMWQFANLYQWIVLFGKVVKLDDNIDIEDLEAECLKPYSTALQDIGLSMLKFLSSHRGLTHELFDEYTRRQFVAKAPNKNPFGTDETPARFADFDIFTKIRVLQLMTQLIMLNPDRVREKAEEQKDIDQTNWRIEPYGWDREDRTYYVLDDNRVYRATEPEPPKPKPKKNTKKAKAALRASKRRRVSTASVSGAEDAGDENSENGEQPAIAEDDGLGGMNWECVAVTLDDVRQFLTTIQKTSDPNEKILRDRLLDHLVPILEKQEESRKRKQLQREKELQNLEKMAHAKRSSRIASKMERHKLDEAAREEERKRREEEAIARKEEQKTLKLERERDNRLMSREERLKVRERRLKDRETRRLQHEDELAQLSEDSRKLGNGEGRFSGRKLQAEIEKNKQALKEIDEEDDWIFDCICGVYGQVDDGTHSVACENCNVWQHSKCLGINEEEAEQDDFHFVCDPCRRREAEKDQPPRIIRIKVNRPGSSSSLPGQRDGEASSPPQPPRSSRIVVELQQKPSSRASLPPTPDQAENVIEGRAPNGLGISEHVEKAEHHAGMGATQATAALPDSKSPVNGLANNPFSSPHPTLLPPDQPPVKARAYRTLHDQSDHNGAPAGELSTGWGAQPQSVNGTLDIPATPSASLPSKQPVTTLPTTKTTSPVLTPSGASESVLLAARSQNGMPSVLSATPQITPSQSENRYDERSSPLPPSRGGLSPTKHSPPIKQANGTGTPNGASSSFSAGSPKPAILPPTAALSPSPPQQILTPPVKQTEPMRPAAQQSPHGQAQFLDTSS